MGHNLISVCHKCKEQIFHFRNEENRQILKFYKLHSDCAKENINNVTTIMDNNGNEMQYYKLYETYKDSNLQLKHNE